MDVDFGEIKVEINYFRRQTKVVRFGKMESRISKIPLQKCRKEHFNVVAVFCIGKPFLSAIKYGWICYIFCVLSSVRVIFSFFLSFSDFSLNILVCRYTFRCFSVV